VLAARGPVVDAGALTGRARGYPTTSNLAVAAAPPGPTARTV
jgi:hypothetical protein